MVIYCETCLRIRYADSEVSQHTHLEEEWDERPEEGEDHMTDGPETNRKNSHVVVHESSHLLDIGMA